MTVTNIIHIQVQAFPIPPPSYFLWSYHLLPEVCSWLIGIATPLTILFRKKQPESVTWSDEYEAAFHKLKATLTTSPVLKVPEVNKPFLVHSDASDVDLGGSAEPSVRW